MLKGIRYDIRIRVGTYHLKRKRHLIHYLIMNMKLVQLRLIILIKMIIVKVQLKINYQKVEIILIQV